MWFSGYVATPNAPFFDALHQTLCFLYHQPHLLITHMPIMYPAKPISNPWLSYFLPCKTYQEWLFHKHSGTLAKLSVSAQSLVMSYQPSPMPIMQDASIPAILCPTILVYLMASLFHGHVKSKLPPPYILPVRILPLFIMVPSNRRHLVFLNIHRCLVFV